MTTPADWYPDPGIPDQLRYWDGASWTEHRAPASVPASTEQTAEPAPPSGSGSHRAPDAGSEPLAPSYEPPVTPQYEAPSFTPPPLPSWDPPVGQNYPAPSTPSLDAPPSGESHPGGQSHPTDQPYPSESYEAAPFAAPPFAPGPPMSPPGSSEGPNKKLVIGILGGLGALVLALVLAFVYVFAIRDDDTAVVASPSSTSTTTTSSETSTSEAPTSETAAPQPSNVGPVTDGSLTFTITDVEAAATVTSTVSDVVGKTAQGTYAVVHLKVGNVGADPVTFIATFQRLNGSGQSLAPDDEATIFAGGGYADIAQGTEVDTVVVFDVPDDVEPTSMFFQQDPTTPGIELTF